MTSRFRVVIDHNPDLPLGGRVMDVAVLVTLDGDGGPAAPRSAAQVIMLDCSGSMAGDKLHQARQAVRAALAALRDGTAFAVVAGTASACMVYPGHLGLAVANERTRAEAGAAVDRLRADGGTAIGSWLRHADLLLHPHDADIKHGLLLTDGRNEHQAARSFAADVASCVGHFVCDARGVGDGWEAGPLLAVADALHGSAEGLTDPARLADEFRSVTEDLMRKEVAGVRLRLWLPARSGLRFLKQVFPRIVDLTDAVERVDDRHVEVDTGVWGAETRDFHLSLSVPEGTVGDEVVVARIAVRAGESVGEAIKVWARWTTDRALSTRISPGVANLTDQTDLADAIDRGMAAHEAGDDAEARTQLGRARELAERGNGNPETLRLLRRITDVDGSGTIRVKRDMAAIDQELIGLTSRRTTRVRRDGDGRG